MDTPNPEPIIVKPDNKEIVSRVRYLITQSGGSQLDFARRIGINPSNLSKHLNGKLPIGESLLNRIVVSTGVSKQWLRDGTETPYAKPGIPTLTINEPISVIPTKRGTPVYDIDVTAGPMSRSMMFANDNIIGTVDIPSIPDDCRIVRVSGDSMCPVINNGDYLAIRELQNPSLLFWGQIYVLLLDDYRLVKYVRKHENPEMVTLRSANPNYDDMEVMRRDIREIMFVHNILHIDTRM